MKRRAEWNKKKREARERDMALRKKGTPCLVRQRVVFSTQEWGPQMASRKKTLEFQTGGPKRLMNMLGSSGCFRWSEAASGGGQQLDFFFPVLQGDPSDSTTGDYGVFESLDAFKEAWGPLGYAGFFDPELSSPDRFVEFIDDWCLRKNATGVFYFRILRVPQEGPPTRPAATARPASQVAVGPVGE